MPKDRSGKRRSLGHEPSAKAGSRAFAVQDNAVKHVEIGEMEDASGNEILRAMEAEQEAEAGPSLKKKEKRQLKHELFIQRLEETRAPYSKSHNRRIKRKERDEIAGGALKGLSSVLSQLDDAPAAAAADSGAEIEAAPQRARPRPGQIGEGKSAPLSKAQRKKALKTEKFRLPLIMQNPEFKANPFATIRTHAQNTLIQHQPPSGTA
ncbi:unnamed protein product [Peniophora sp. CBMAI 1063]|nr:unnamed protein product [Peniophora sp. CBMAI 1063]